MEYNLFPIGIALVLAYGTSFILSRKDIIRREDHRKFWNVMLLISFLCTGALGVILVLRTSLGIVVPLPINQLFWHVETGIAMAFISVFHMLWHGDYFLSILAGRPPAYKARPASQKK